MTVRRREILKSAVVLAAGRWAYPELAVGAPPAAGAAPATQPQIRSVSLRRSADSGTVFSLVP